MLEVERKPQNLKRITKKNKNRDIIIKKFEIKTEVNDDGSITTRRIPIKVNITKKVNESKKLIKNYTAEQKIEELERIFSK